MLGQMDMLAAYYGVKHYCIGANGFGWSISGVNANTTKLTIIN